MAKPTYQDAEIMLQVSQWGTAMGLQTALNWVWSDKFKKDYAAFRKKHPPGSKGFRRATTVLGWFETIGTLYKNGLFNGDLLFDWLLITGPWERMQGIARGLRKESGSPRLYENFEALAKAQQEWEG